MLHRFPLWALGPLCFLSALDGQGAGWAIPGLVLTLLFTVPAARNLQSL